MSACQGGEVALSDTQKLESDDSHAESLLYVEDSALDSIILLCSDLHFTPGSSRAGCVAAMPVGDIC